MRRLTLAMVMMLVGCTPQEKECVAGCLLTPPAPFCGDGVTQDPETCDREDFTGNTCASFGLVGELRCNKDCSLDMSGCHK